MCFHAFGLCRFRFDAGSAIEGTWISYCTCKNLMECYGEDTMKRCRRCGGENENEDNFCRSCGARLDASKAGPTSDKNLIERFRDSSIFFKIIVAIVAIFMLLVVSAWASHILFGTPLESFTDGDPTYRQSEFDSLDIDGDGALSFYEIQDYASGITYGNHQDIFDSADKNGDGLLKGAEFDGYIYRLENYYKDLEKQKKAEEEKAKEKKTSSSSSGYNPYFEDEGHESCPICGGDEFSEIYSPEYGDMVWQCDYCGEILDDDDLYENWWESQGIKFMLPSLERNLG